MQNYKKLNSKLKSDLYRIEPSYMSSLVWYPCCIRNNLGEIIDRVYVAEKNAYFKVWGFYPDNTKYERHIDVSTVVDVMESSSRLPARFANELYNHGETGMGYYVFIVNFLNGTTQKYLTGSAVDFIIYPPGLTGKDVSKVTFPKGVDSSPMIESTLFYRCLYEE